MAATLNEMYTRLGEIEVERIRLDNERERLLSEISQKKTFPNSNKEWRTIKQASEELGVSRSAIYSLIDRMGTEIDVDYNGLMKVNLVQLREIGKHKKMNEES